MFCDKCKHKLEIRDALRPCQSCEHANHNDRLHGDTPDPACSNCPHLKEVVASLRPCQSCEAGKLHGQISTDAGDAAEAAYRHAVTTVHAPTDGVTNLPPDVEDALRKALCVLFQFEPLQLLLIQHVCHGRGISSFREVLADLKARLASKYDLSEGSASFRAVAHTWKNAIVAKFPPAAAFFGA